jgi:hypothetical protein
MQVEMTKLLKQVFEEASKLPADEQDAIGRILLDELASEHRWDQLFASSPDLLSALADDALAEHRAGKTKILSPNKL